MPVQWTPDLAVGVSEIDDQHRGLFEKANTLVSTLDTFAEPDEEVRDRIEEALGALAEAVVRHFATEEKYMTRLRCPEYAAHRDLHESFIDDFASLKKDIERRAPAACCAAEIVERVLGWFAEHIADSDRRLGAFLNGKLRAA